jgi:hypothetical protein
VTPPGCTGLLIQQCQVPACVGRASFVRCVAPVQATCDDGDRRVILSSCFYCLLICAPTLLHIKEAEHLPTVQIPHCTLCIQKSSICPQRSGAGAVGCVRAGELQTPAVLDCMIYRRMYGSNSITPDTRQHDSMSAC